MRHLVLALMIVLLPLRGWAGDVMAVEMASTAIAASASAAGTHEITAQAMPDCHDQAASHSEADKAVNSDHCGTCQACQACQACHTVAVSPSPLEVAVSFASPQLHTTHAAAFTSAAAALGQKPPIS